MAAQQRPADAPANANAECVGPASEQAGKAASCEGCPNKEACATGKNKPNAGSSDIAERLSAVKHKILVLSGKGGVGKSTFSAQLAWALADAKKNAAGADGGEPFQVGIMDIDICGPSVPKMMHVEKEEVRKTGSGWDLVWAADNLGVMSVGFMLGSPDDAIIWRGPRKDGLIRQFLADVEWGALDFLIVDAPPGTSDEHISIATYLKANGGVDGAVIVTTPQEVSLMDVRKELNFCRKVGIPVLGVVENMSGFACPNCAHRTDIFAPAKGGAAQMSADFKVPFLGAIPLDTQLLSACEEGVSYLSTRAAAPARQPFISVVQTLMKNARLADTWNGATFPEPAAAPASAAAGAAKPRAGSVDVEMGTGAAAAAAAAAPAAAAPAAAAAVTPAAAQQQIAALTAANTELQKQLAAAVAQLNALRAGTK